MNANTYIADVCYLAATILFILGLKGLNAPQTARRGLLLAEIPPKIPS
jgi:NAD/NADP transhydrogenase beta subunit